MSLNHSKTEKNELHYRKAAGGGRSGHQRNFVGGSGRGGGGSTAPPLSNPSSLSSTRSYKKTHNAQGVQSRVSVGSANAPESNTAPAAQNGSHAQPTLHVSTSNPNDTSAHRSNRAIPRAPSSQSPTMTSESTTPTTPTKGDGAKGFALQFGSISPGFINGMPVPPRTTSAPPNIDEQKQDQAFHDASGRVAAVPAPSAPKPEITKKEVAPISQHATRDISTVKRDTPATSSSSASQAQKLPVLPMGGISMPMSYPQPPVSLQFGGPNPQIQSQAASLAMPPMQMPLQMGVQQQLFMPHHLMQAQGIMHHTQGLGFNPQMGQHPPQLGGLGVNISPQFSPQQPAKFGSARKTVKITHPDTHEELRLEKRSDAYTEGTAPKPHNNVPPQSQNVPSYPSNQPIGYYPNSYVGGPPFYGPPSSHPFPAGPPVSQASRYNYPVGQAPHAMTFVNQPASISSSIKGGNAGIGTGESSNIDFSQEIQHTVSFDSVSLKFKGGINSGDKGINLKPVEKGEFPKIYRPAAPMSSSHLKVDSQIHPDNYLPHSKPSVSVSGGNVAEETRSASHVESSLTTGHLDGRKWVTVVKCDSLKERQEKPVMEGHSELSLEVVAQSSSDLLPHAVDVVTSPKNTISEQVEPRKDLGNAGAGKGAEEAHYDQSFTSRAAPDDVIHSGVVHDDHTCSSSAVVKSGNCINTSIDHCAGQEEPPHVEASGTKGNGITKENPDINSGNLAPGSVNASSCGMQLSTSLHAVRSEMSPDTFSDKHMMEVSDDGSSERRDSTGEDDAFTKSHLSCVDNETVSVSVKGDTPEGQVREIARPTSSGSVSCLSNTASELNKTKGSSARGKKKIKQILQKADAQGTTSDLYNAYKGPEEKKGCTTSTEHIESPSGNDLELASTICGHDGPSTKDKDDQSKAEPEDWEDVVDSTSKLEAVSKIQGEIVRHNAEDMGTVKKYSRDFLLTFSEQCTNLPDGFEITPDIVDILTRPNSSSARVVDRQYPSPGRIVDRPSGGPRGDRRGGGMMDADRWHKLQNPFPSPRDMGLDPGYGPMSMGFHPGQAGNYGVLRNPRGPPHVQYPILSVPMQSMQRNDPDRWRNANFRGMMMPLQTPMQVMHKAERKYEVGKVTDEEQAKQRRLKGILNKLTPQNFDKLFAQVKDVNIDNVVTLNGVISQIFDKALTEPTFCEMYSNFCYELSLVLPELSEDDEKITFKRLLLNKCQEEFEWGEREEEEANKVDHEDEIKLSAEQREERRLKARRRILGNIRLIGELYKRRMLTERIMHECIKKLLGQYPNTAEEDIESLCKLMSTIGDMIDHPKGKEHMNAYFDMMENLSNNMKLSSRVRFMLKDSIDLRKNKWQQRRKVEGPKKIDEVHRDAAQERQAQTTRLSRGGNMGSSMRRGQPMEFVPRGSIMMSSPSGHMSNFRGMPSQGRGYVMQDARNEEKHSFDNRTITVPLPQRPSGDDSITLGPQGGLARGMSIRGQPSVSSTPMTDSTLGHGDTRRTTGGLNGFTSMPERAAPNSRDGSFSRHAPASSSVNRDHKNAGRGMGRSVPASPSGRVEETSLAQNISSEKVWPEEHLKEKSVTAIKEFYSAKDEKEVDLCVRELNTPSFYPSVISIWVCDSFERKDLEREMLNKLIVNLSKPRDGRLFMPDQLIKGFESVLADLEDTVTDAPRAPDFLGGLFAKLILENIVSLKEIGELLYNGGEESGSLREVGLAGDVLGSVLENIKSEKGEAAAKDICSSCNLQLEDFRPPDPVKSRKLELFI